MIGRSNAVGGGGEAIPVWKLADQGLNTYAPVKPTTTYNISKVNGTNMMVFYTMLGGSSSASMIGFAGFYNSISYTSSSDLTVQISGDTIIIQVASSSSQSLYYCFI